MGATKIDLFSITQNETAVLMKALGHPARIAILEYLVKVDACICGDIVNEVGLAQPTVSQHLRELKNAGWIKGTIEGTAICYCVDKAALMRVQAYFGDFATTLSNRENSCC